VKNKTNAIPSPIRKTCLTDQWLFAACLSFLPQLAVGPMKFGPWSRAADGPRAVAPLRTSSNSTERQLAGRVPCCATTDVLCLVKRDETTM
jgi:hypothetical protein